MKATRVGCILSIILIGGSCQALASLESDSGNEAMPLPRVEQSYAQGQQVSAVAGMAECHIRYQPRFIHAPRDGAIVGVRLVPGLVDC